MGNDEVWFPSRNTKINWIIIIKDIQKYLEGNE